MYREYQYSLQANRLPLCVRTRIECWAVKTISYFRAAGVFAACLLGVFVLPFIAVYAHAVLPPAATNLLFFSTQLLFPYGGLVTRDASGSHAIFSQGAANALVMLHWGLIATAFAWAARRMPVRYSIIAAIATIVSVGIATHVIFGMLGVTVELEGP